MGGTRRLLLVIDMRCLQDAAHGERGIAGHAASLVKRVRQVAALRGARIIGVVDPRRDGLAPEIAAVLDEVRPNFYFPELLAGGVFLNLWAMGPGQTAAARLLLDSRIASAAVIYDFIPLDDPARYLAAPAARLDYAMARGWLPKYRLFLPISVTTGARLEELAPGVPRVVTGVPLGLFDGAGEAAPPAPPRHLLMVGGDDPRKNPEVFIHAHAASAALQGRRISLVLTGAYPAARREELLALAAAAGGDPALLELPGRLAPAALRAAYGQAYGVITPSRAEGFSLPVVEAMAAGVASIGSDIPAHAALLGEPEWRFGVDDVAGLAALCERLVADVGWRAKIVAAQAEIWPAFRAEAVAERFWSAVAGLAPVARPAVVRRGRPRIALLSPMPPARTGVADFSACLVTALGARADVTVFAPDPASRAGPVWGLPHLSGRFDRVVSVLGNSAPFHGRIYDLLRRHGAACICHDSRLLGFAMTHYGAARTAALAAQELGRAVSEAEVEDWAADESTREAGFFGEIAAAARPLIFHNRQSVAEVAVRFGVTARFLPFAVYRPWGKPVDEAARAAARKRLSWAPGETVIVSFGFAERFKGVEPAIRAVELLREAGVDCRLVWAGQAGRDAAGFEALAASLGVSGQVSFGRDFMGEDVYRDHLAGADFGLQLRIGPAGNVSGALADCIAAGLPSVANEDLAATIEAPGYVRRVGDELDPAAICEAVLGLMGGGKRADFEAARQACCQVYGMEAYAGRLLDLLDCELTG